MLTGLHLVSIDKKTNRVLERAAIQGLGSAAVANGTSEPIEAPQAALVPTSAYRQWSLDPRGISSPLLTSCTCRSLRRIRRPVCLDRCSCV